MLLLKLSASGCTTTILNTLLVRAAMRSSYSIIWMVVYFFMTRFSIYLAIAFSVHFRETKQLELVDILYKLNLINQCALIPRFVFYLLSLWRIDIINSIFAPGFYGISREPKFDFWLFKCLTNMSLFYHQFQQGYSAMWSGYQGISIL